MLDTIHLSGDAVAGAIWLIIFVVWGIGKFLSQLAEQKVAREYDQKKKKQSEGGLETELRGFLETITGETLPDPFEEQVPRPPPPPMPVRPRAPHAVPRGIPGDLTYRPPPPRPAPTPWAGRATELPQSPSSRDGRTPLDSLIAPEFSFLSLEVLKRLQTTALPGHEYMLNSRQVMMKLPMYGMRLPDPGKEAHASIPFRIPNRRALQRAMIDRIVLGPPRGMSQKMPFEDQREI